LPDVARGTFDLFGNLVELGAAPSGPTLLYLQPLHLVEVREDLLRDLVERRVVRHAPIVWGTHIRRHARSAEHGCDSVARGQGQVAFIAPIVRSSLLRRALLRYPQQAQRKGGPDPSPRE